MATGLLRRVIAEVNHTPFILPQSSGMTSHHFCNENIYGNFTFMMACGVVRLGPCTASGSKETKKQQT